MLWSDAFMHNKIAWKFKMNSVLIFLIDTKKLLRQKHSNHFFQCNGTSKNFSHDQKKNPLNKLHRTIYFSSHTPLIIIFFSLWFFSSLFGFSAESPENADCNVQNANNTNRFLFVYSALLLCIALFLLYIFIAVYMTR